MRYAWILMVWCVVVLGRVGVVGAEGPSGVAGRIAPAGDSSNIIEGTLLQTARGGGTWRSFFNAHNASVRAANREAIWLGSGGNLWRYNVRSKKLDAYVSPLTHPDVSLSAYVTLADDGSLALSSGASSYLWSAGQGWSRLPQAGGITNQHFPAFDEHSNLFISNYRGFYQWSEGLWQQVQKDRGELQLVAVGDGWAQLKDQIWYDHSLGKHAAYAKGAGRNSQLTGFYRVKGMGLAFFWVVPQGVAWEDGSYALYRVTPEAMEELDTGAHLGLDLATGEGFRCVMDADRKDATIQSLAGKMQGTIALPADYPSKSILLRDANGDYWLGARRFDGHTWQAVLPAGAFDYAGDMQEGILTGRLVYDEQKMNWVDTTPELPVEVKLYDAKTHSGWLKREKHAGSNERTMWDQMVFGADGSRKILQSVPANDRDYGWCVPRFADGQGNWWFRGRWRWDGKYGHVYDDGYETRNMKENVVPPEFLLSDAGVVWHFKMDRTWERYDAAKDNFEVGSPYDDFSFTLGGRTLAILARTRDKEFEDLPYRVFEKRAGKWAGFEPPFGMATPRGGPWVFGLPGAMVRGSRMLVATEGGIFEWDSARDLWAYLLPRGQYWACFDARGHRVMSADKLFNQIFIYDGDPIANPADVGADLSKTMENLLREMDDDSWRRRDNATGAMINLLHKNPKTVKDYLTKVAARGDLSGEVAARVEKVLSDRLREEAPRGAGGGSYDEHFHYLSSRLGNSLFERMVPPMTPSFPGGYVVKVGMRYDLAESIFLAAGAPSSSALINQHSPDGSYRGFLLRDNTMVYVRVDTKAEPATITQLGLGQYGRGYDSGWPWDDAGKNGAKSIELKPAPATRPAN